MTTFVTLGVKMKSKTSSTETILSGMVLDVVRSTHVYPPWLRKEISPLTSDDIEMRLCTDEDESSENVYIRSIEIYVM